MRAIANLDRALRELIYPFFYLQTNTTHDPRPTTHDPRPVYPRPTHPRDLASPLQYLSILGPSNVAAKLNVLNNRCSIQSFSLYIIDCRHVCKIMRDLGRATKKHVEGCGVQLFDVVQPVGCEVQKMVTLIGAISRTKR